MMDCKSRAKLKANICFGSVNKNLAPAGFFFLRRSKIEALQYLRSAALKFVLCRYGLGDAEVKPLLSSAHEKLLVLFKL